MRVLLGLPFLGIKEFVDNRKGHGGAIEYNIAAQIRAVYSLDVKFIDEYKKAVLMEVSDYESFLLVLKRFVENHYSWNYTNGISDTKADKSAATDIFDIRFIGAERTVEEVRSETKREITVFTKDTANAATFGALSRFRTVKLNKYSCPTKQPARTLPDA